LVAFTERRVQKNISTCRKKQIPRSTWIFSPLNAAKTVFDHADKASRAMAMRPCRLLRGLNHLFVSGMCRSIPAEYESAEHVDAEGIDRIAAFVLSRRIRRAP
jgi:hypothetical protein